MKLWKISQEINENWDTYDSAIVAARTDSEAKMIHPSGDQTNWAERIYSCSTWVQASELEHVKVEYLGTAKPGTKEGVILASFNAG